MCPTTTSTREVRETSNTQTFTSRTMMPPLRGVLHLLHSP